MRSEWVYGRRRVPEYGQRLMREIKSQYLDTRDMSPENKERLSQVARILGRRGQEGFPPEGSPALEQWREAAEGEIKSYLFPLVREQESQQGLVYLLRAAGLVKIGWTTDWQRRLRAYRTQCPPPVDLLLLIASEHPRRMEKQLHQHFVHRRVEREWFDLQRHDLEVLERWACFHEVVEWNLWG